ncbi:MAG: hypothetical protein QXW35_04930, partial [Candidatus Aenigmatarchaeota archaeon]
MKFPLILDEIRTINFRELDSSLFFLPSLSQRIEILKNEIKKFGLVPSILIFSSELENKKEIEELVNNLKKNKDVEIYLFDEKNGEIYNLKDCLVYDIKQLPDELAIKLINSPLFEYIGELWKEKSKKHSTIEEELMYILSTKIGLEDLFNKERLAKKIIKYFEDKGELDKLKKYIESISIEENDNDDVEYLYREKTKRRKLLGLLLLGLIVAGGLLYYYFGYLPQKEKEERMKERINELRSIGLDYKAAEEFDNLFNKFYPYNSTIYEFAKYFKESKELTLKTFEIFKNFKSSNEFLSIAINKPNSLEFLEKYEDLVRNLYIEDLKYALELYSKNSTLFDIIYNNIKNDEKLTDLIAKTIIISKYGDIIPFNIEYEIEYNKPIEQAKRIK